MTARARNRLVLPLVVVGVAGILLGAITTNVIRLGPSIIALPTESVAIDAAWFRFPDLDSAYDYYAILVRVVNHVDTPSVYPYAIEVNLTVIGGETVDGFHPTAGDRTQQESVSLVYGGSPPDMTLILPAGYVQRYDGGFYMLWDVAGKRGLASQPVFTKSADFYAEFRVPEGAALEAHPEVFLEWYYVNALQAYSVATRGASAVCYYVPDPASEGTGPYGACG